MCKYRTNFYLKLLQKSHIWTHEVSHIRNPISDHHEAIESKSKGKSRIYLWVESSLSYDIGVYQSRSHEFYPTRTFAYLASDSLTEWTREVHLDSWFDKRKIPRSHSYCHFFSEYIREHSSNREFEMTDTDSLVYDDSLYLIECIVMCRIDIFIAEHSSRDNCPNWSIFISHDEILHAWRLSCEHIASSLEPECILHISCWMCFRDIHCIEVEILCRHLHRVVYIEPHPYKCILHFSLYERDRMEASFFPLKWHCDIFLFCRESLCNEIFFYSIAFGLKSVCDDISSLIRSLTNSTSFFRWEIFESLENGSELTRFSQDRVAVVDQGCLIYDAREMGEDLGLEILDFLDHKKER